MTARQTLKQYFGYDAFRSGQQTLIDDILTGKDVLGVMPTGAGKSVCFQVPALIMGGVTIIVSPLISLMKDQVNALTQSGIAAAYINSTLTERQITTVFTRAASGAYKLVYVAPERLLSYDFLTWARAADISMLTVDEAHCISQWGQDFRPSYATIPEFIAQLRKRPPVSAFTATATPIVREDIINQLALRQPTVLVSGFDRQNLHFDVQKPKDKFAALTAFLRDRGDRSGIVYCSTRATVEEVCDKLNNAGYSASRYHAGLPDTERSGNQDDFLYDRVQIMVATNAFGMGI
ncbi:MAG: RecQ family ATP-dependent DNA helicase, partial [Defluviitaleaceae bacterium]|nr:RecQ family ATP-dependent DNA helicase [Defluviitaleaceae bacterium]